MRQTVDRKNILNNYINNFLGPVSETQIQQDTKRSSQNKEIEGSSFFLLSIFASCLSAVSNKYFLITAKY